MGSTTPVAALLRAADADGVRRAPKILLLATDRQSRRAARWRRQIRIRSPRALVHAPVLQDDAWPGGLKISDETTSDSGVDNGSDLTLLAALGPFDAIIDLRQGKFWSQQFREIFYFLRAGGVLIFPDVPQRSRQFATLLSRVNRLEPHAVPAPTRTKDNRPRKQMDLAALRDSIEVVESPPGHVLVRLRTATAVKLRESAMNEFTRRRGAAAGRVVDVVPARSYAATNELLLSDPERGRWLPRHFHAGELSIREHYGAVCLPRSGAIQGHVALAGSFDRSGHKRLSGLSTVEWAPNFVKAPPEPRRHLAGVYFHLDHEYRVHFGHTLRDQVPKLWAWPRILREHPNAKVLMTRGPLAAWERTLWKAAGIDPERIEVVQEPVSVECLVTATSAYRLPDHQHPVAAETYGHVGASLHALAPARPRPRRLFLSRRSSYTRHCVNADEVEAMVRRHGFDVVHPEDHPLPEQVAMVREAETVAGFSGSGLHQVCFLAEPTPVICISSDTFTTTVEPNNCALLGNPMAMLWLRSEAPPLTVPGKGAGKAAFRARYRYDAARDAPFLNEALEWATSR